MRLRIILEEVAAAFMGLVMVTMVGACVFSVGWIIVEALS